jgi:PAS domain S-box-containing protein
MHLLALSRLFSRKWPQPRRDPDQAGLEQYRAIVDTATDGIIVIDDNGTIQSFNRAAQRIFGYEPDEVIRKNVRELMPEPDRGRHDSYLANYRATGIAKIIGSGREVEGRHKDGSKIPLELSIGEWMSDSRRYFTGILRDLTERKRAEERRSADEAKYRAIIDTAVDAIVLINA